MNYSRLDTEKINPRTLRIDTFSIPRILETISREDATVIAAVRREKKAIAGAVALSVQTLRRNGRLFFVGAGTSGRLGVMEAAECPPTFHTDPKQIQAIMAGGKNAVFLSREGAEDDASAGKAEVKKRARPGDMVVGIAASAVTPFVLAALRQAHKIGCSTALITCNADWKKIFKGFKPSVVVALKTGPEVIAGSTRMKAGSATKMVLNMLTTACMVRLGKVYGNRMVDLQTKSKKLKERAVRIVRELGAVSRPQAIRLLKRAQGRAKVAIVMARKNINRRQAAALLKRKEDSLRKALEN